jgi:hypothetical protein
MCVTLSVTAWRLADPSGRRADCTIKKVEGPAWEVAVRHGRELVIAERCPSDDAAFERSTEIWSVLLDQGWTEPRH